MQKHLELDLVQVESIDFAIRHRKVQILQLTTLWAKPNTIPWGDEEQQKQWKAININ